MKNAADVTSESKKHALDDQFLSENPWIWWRNQMPIVDRWSYFDHAAVSPLSGPAAKAISQYGSEASEHGDTKWPDWAASAERLRGQFASLLGAESSEICLVANTTTGVNLVAEGWPWQAGDSVVVPEGEFPSNLFPWQNQLAKGVEVRLVPRHGGEVRVDDLMARVDGSTRMIAASWVGYASGYRIDVAELVRRAHEQGVLVFLDAIQGLGVYPLDLRQTPVDFLAADGHKWLLGPEGIGVAMIARRHLERIRCGNVGWNSVKNAFNYASPEFELRHSASRFEAGSCNLLGAAALERSLDLFLKVRGMHGDDSIASRILQLVSTLESSLNALGISTRLSPEGKHRSGIVTFEVPGVSPSEFRKSALKQNVVVSCRDGGVRASIHAYNNEFDLEQLMSVVRQFLL